MLHYLCSRIRLRDRLLINSFFEMAAKLGNLVTNHEGFLHSIVTGFHLSTLSPKRAQMAASTSKSTNTTGRKRQTSRSRDTTVKSLPPLPSSIRKKAIETFFIPSIVEATEELGKCKTAINNDNNNDGNEDMKKELLEHRIQVSLVHAHFARFITLESTLKSLGIQEVTSMLQRAILPLAMAKTPMKSSEILQSPELCATIVEFYTSYEFRRARRYYTKIFERFPNLQTACGIDISRIGTPSNPSPSPTPSPSPGSTVGTPFDASPSPSFLPSSSPSPSIGASSDNNSIHGQGSPPPPPPPTHYNEDSSNPRKQPRLE